MEKHTEFFVKTYEDSLQMLYVHLASVFMAAQSGEASSFNCICEDLAFRELSLTLQKKLAYEIDWFFGSYQCDGSLFDFSSRFIKRDALKFDILNEFTGNYQFCDSAIEIPASEFENIRGQLPAVKCILNGEKQESMLNILDSAWFRAFNGVYLNEKDIQEDSTVRECLIFLNKSLVRDYNTLILQIQQFCNYYNKDVKVVAPAVHFVLLSSIWRNRSKSDLEGLRLYSKMIKEALYNVN